MLKYSKVCIIGAEGWGSAISTAVCKNVLNDQFDSRVHIYVFDELVRSNYLSEVMNERHENIKYLPGIKLASNLIAVNDLLEAARNADILIFTTPHSFIKAYCNILEGNIKKTAYAVSLIKGLEHVRDGEIDLYSHAIANQLGIPCYSVMSANRAMEMAQGKLCEITIGCNNEAHSKQLTSLFQTENCIVFTIDDVDGVEMCNTLKDLVGMSAGIIDGLHLGENARVACLHLGIKEMMRFVKHFNPSTKMTTFLESCGLAHSVASSYADKNVTFAKNFVSSRKTIQEIEANLLNGRKLLGPIVAEEVYAYLEKEGLHKEFPLFSIVHRICQREVLPHSIVEIIRNHPDLKNSSVTQLQKNEYLLPEPSTESVLENVADTIPEYSPNELPGISFETGTENIVADKNVCWNGYDNIIDENRSSKELNESPLKSQVVTGAINEPNTCNESVEFIFKMGSPEVCLSLKDTYISPEIKALWPRTKNSSAHIDGDFSSNEQESKLIIKSEIQDFTSSNNQQKVQMSKSEKYNAIAKDPLTEVGFNKLINQHMRPIVEKYEGLKVTVRQNNKNSYEKKSPETPKKTEEKTYTKPGSKGTMESKVKPITTPQTDEPNPKVQKTNSTNEQSEHVLYDKNPIFGMHLFEDESHLSKYLEMVQSNEKIALDKSEDKNHPNIKKIIKDGHENKLDSGKVSLQSNENYVEAESLDSKFSDNKLNREGYKYDYKISVHSTKVPIAKPMHKGIDARVPFPYSKTDESIPNTNAKLDAPDYRQKYNSMHGSNQDENRLQEMTKDKLEIRGDAPKVLVDTSKIPFDNQKADRFNPLDATSSGTLNVIGSVKENQSYCRLEHSPQHVQHPETMFKEHSQDIPMSPNSGNQELHNHGSIVGSGEGSKITAFKFRNELPAKRLSVDVLKSFGILQDSNGKRITVEKKPTEFDGRTIESTNNQKYIEPTLCKYNDCNNSSDKIQGYWESDVEDKFEVNYISPKSEIEVDDAILGDKMPKAIKTVHDNESEERYEKISAEDSNKDSTWSRFDKKRRTSKPSSKIEDVASTQELKLKVEEAIFDGNVNANLNTIDNSNMSNTTDYQSSQSSFDDNRHSSRPARIKGLKYNEEMKAEGEEISAKNCKRSYRKDMQETNDKEKSVEVTSESPKSSTSKTDVGKDQMLLNQFIKNVDKFQMIPLDTAADPIVSLRRDKNVLRKNAKRKNYEGAKEDAKFKQTSPEEDQHLSDKFKRSRRDEDERTPTKFERTNPDEGQHLSAGNESQSKKAANKLYSEWEWLLDNDKFDDALEEFKREKQRDNELGPTGSKEKELENHSSKIAWPSNAETMTNENPDELLTTVSNESKKKLAQKTASYGSQVDESNLIAQRSETESNAEIAEDKVHQAQNKEVSQEQSTQVQPDPEESHVSKITKKLSKIMTKGHKDQLKTKERPIDYQGPNPYNKDENVLSKHAFSNVHERVNKKQRRVVVKPFHPPINPRIRIPRPPFDVRDHEYHTVNFRPPPDLLRHASLPQKTLTVGCHATQAGTRSVAKLPRPVLKLPPSMMRSSVLAVELGIFAALISRYRGSYK